MNKTLLSRYEEIVNKYVDEFNLIAKGIRCCQNKHEGGLLLTGINPSGKEKKETDKQFQQYIHYSSIQRAFSSNSIIGRC